MPLHSKGLNGMFLCLRQFRHSGRHTVLHLSVRPSVRPSIWSIRSFDWSSVARVVNKIFRKRMNRIYCKLACSGQGDETVNFWGQEVKDQRHTTPKLDLKTWPFGQIGFVLCCLVTFICFF